MEGYDVICKVGEGAFGIVLKAEDHETKEIVALKQIPLQNVEDGNLPDCLIREIQALRNLEHENILKLFKVFPKFPGVTLVLEYMPSNLSKIIKRSKKQNVRIPEAHVKSYMQMLLQGLSHMHENRVMHRDLKPKNLLISAQGQMKLGDFGLARVMAAHGNGVYTNQVSTRWYKSPELLYGSESYTQSIDIWAIFAELMMSKPFFPGQSDIDQLSRIFAVRGTPNEQTWPDISNLPDYGKIVFDELLPRPLKELIPSASAEALSLLERLLVVFPSDRISASEALKNVYFTTEPLPTPFCALASHH